MKKIFFLISYFFTYHVIYAQQAPAVNCVGLPGCPDKNIKNPSPATVNQDFAQNAVGKFAIDFIITFIEYIAIIAVISLMLGGIKYILSGGEEEKVKKAKSWIIWSLAGVFMSVSAWGIIKFISQLYIN